MKVRCSFDMTRKKDGVAPPRLLAAVPVQAKPLGVGQVEVTLAVTDKPIVIGLGK